MREIYGLPVILSGKKHEASYYRGCLTPEICGKLVTCHFEWQKAMSAVLMTPESWTLMLVLEQVW
jgi:hypothetical protein